MTEQSANYDQVIDYWFDDEVAEYWFNSTEEFDEKLRIKFEAIYLDAKEGKYDNWQDTALGCLALVILYDQIPLNIYRGKKQSFATEALARKVAEFALSKSYDEQMTGKQKAFLYMPFMHSENLDDQNRSLALYEKANLTNNVRFAKHHRDIVKRFGRFPHRNKILGRKSTEAEQIYLQSKEAFLG